MQYIRYAFPILPLLSAFLLQQFVERKVYVPTKVTSTRASTYISVMKSVFSVLIYIVGFYFMFTFLNINLTPLFASAGVVGIIVGLGVRSFIEDFFTGLLILTEDTIRVGDYVDISGNTGVAESLGLRTVRLRDSTGAVHIFPNSQIKQIINYSKRQARVIIDIPVKINQSVDKVFRSLDRSIMQLRRHPFLGKVILEQSRIEGIESIIPGQMIVRVLILTKASERWNASRTFRKIVLQQFEQDKILLA